MNQKTEPQGGALAIVGARISPPSDLQSMLTDLGVDHHGWSVMVNTIYPGAKTPQAVIQALQYCRKRGLDPFKKPIHIVPVFSNGKETETIWEGINSVRITAMRTGQFVGVEETEFGPRVAYDFTESTRNGGENKFRVVAPEWARVTVLRRIGDMTARFVGPKIYFSEFYTKKSNADPVPNDRWRRSPSQMLEKCAEAAALRKAFPEELGDVGTLEERESDDAPDQPSAAPMRGERPTHQEVVEAVATEGVDPVDGTKKDKPEPERTAQAGGDLFGNSGDEQPDADGIRPSRRKMIETVYTCETLDGTLAWAQTLSEVSWLPKEKDEATAAYNIQRTKIREREAAAQKAREQAQAPVDETQTGE